MSELNLGVNIAELRKQKGISQDALAKVVGVSGQAVSKWESGGSPDLSLLPAIADYFDVSIDQLFGRKMAMDINSLHAELAESISCIEDSDERVREAIKYCWTIEMAIMGGSAKDLNSTLDDLSSDRMFSQMLLNGGCTSFGICEALQYFLIMPEPRDGWGKTLHFKEEYIQLFSLLADEAALKVLFFLYKKHNSSFTQKYLENELDIDEDKAESIIKLLKDYKLLDSLEVELDDEQRTIYTFKSNFAFIPLLTFAEEMILRPSSFYVTNHSRDTPYL